MKTMFSRATRQTCHRKFWGNTVTMRHQLMEVPLPEGGLEAGNVLQKTAKDLHSLSFRQNLKKVAKNTDVISGYILSWSYGHVVMSYHSCSSEDSHSIQTTVCAITTLAFLQPFPSVDDSGISWGKASWIYGGSQTSNENCYYRWWFIHRE